MAQDLPSVTVQTPAETTVITTTVKKSRWGRAYDCLLGFLFFMAALLASMGDINLASFGFTPTQAAWIGFALFAIRFWLAQRPVKLMTTSASPGSTTTTNEGP